MSTLVSEFLTSVRALVDTPAKWTKKAFARDDLGREVSSTSPKATCFGTAGAFMHLAADVDDIPSIYMEAWNLLSETLYDRDPFAFNDHPSTTHAMVLAKFDEAIRVAKSKEANNAHV